MVCAIARLTYLSRSIVMAGGRVVMRQSVSTRLFVDTRF